MPSLCNQVFTSQTELYCRILLDTKKAMLYTHQPLKIKKVQVKASFPLGEFVRANRIEWRCPFMQYNWSMLLVFAPFSLVNNRIAGQFASRKRIRPVPVENRLKLHSHSPKTEL